MTLTRRELLDQALRATAAPGAALFFSAFFSNAQTHQHASDAPPQPDLLHDYQPKFFSPEDFQALQSFTEILIPTDEFPGAREAHCAHYIDFVVQASAEVPQTQANWRKVMESLRAAGFHDAAADSRLALVTAMSQPEMDPSAHHPAFPAYRLIKQQTSFAFYTSRIGMIETLDYKGNSYNLSFPPCNHPEHQSV